MKRLLLALVIGVMLRGAEFEQVELETLGIDEYTGSASFLDYNSDGIIDFWAGMAYINDGTGKFTKWEHTKWDGGKVMCWADYNNDGYPDALTVKISWITSTPRMDTCWFILYENSGPPDYVLVDVSEDVGLGFAFLDKQPNDPAWLDYDADGLLDFYYSGYEFVPLNSEDDYPYWSGQPDYLFHNTGSAFEDVSEQAGIRVGGADTLCARGVSVADYDNDGDADIFVSVYRLQPNLLWRNDGAGNFSNVAEEAGVIGTLNQGYYGHNIGAAWGDYNNDGYLDLFTPITHHPGNVGDPTNHLWANSGPPGWTFTDHIASSGIRNAEIGSAPAWVDYDNDGDLDLYWLNLYGSPGKQGWLYRNDGGNVFTDVTVSVGIRTWGNKSYVHWVDIDQDGRMDLYAPYSNTGGSFKIVFMNTADRGHWLELDFEGTESNRSAIGTRVWAYCDDLLVMREVAPDHGNGYGAMFIARQHLGLGDHDVIDSLVIRWPCARIDRILDLAADQLIGMVEGPPSAPPRLVYTSWGDNYQFGWSAPPERDVAGYRLWQRMNTGDDWTLLADEIPADSVTWDIMLEPPLGEVSITAYDYCEEDNESPHSAVAVGVVESNQSSVIGLEVGSLSAIICCRFTLLTTSEIELSIYDATGRKVRNLTSGIYLPGAHEVRWPGTDDAGTLLPSGPYFVLLSIDGELELSRKTVLR